jgi:hypothetical protein
VNPEAERQKEAETDKSTSLMSLRTLKAFIKWVKGVAKVEKILITPKARRVPHAHEFSSRRRGGG